MERPAQDAPFRSSRSHRSEVAINQDAVRDHTRTQNGEVRRGNAKCAWGGHWKPVPGSSRGLRRKSANLQAFSGGTRTCMVCRHSLPTGDGLEHAKALHPDRGRGSNPVAPPTNTPSCLGGGATAAGSDVDDRLPARLVSTGQKERRPRRASVSVAGPQPYSGCWAGRTGTHASPY
jgi:hypothetical protein